MPAKITNHNRVDMKRKLKIMILTWIAILAVTSSVAAQTSEVTMESLLYEIIDREGLARFPLMDYQCLQASSYNRESVSPNLPGWFADSDGVGFIRTEEINGKTEWVLMEDEGPGCVTRIWAVCFYYGLENITGANIKFYLDGSNEPAINTNFFRLVKGQDFIERPFADSTARAGVLNFPIPYAKSCKITMDQKSFYNIINFRKYPIGTRVRTFTMDGFNATKVLRGKVTKEILTCPDTKGKVTEQNQKIESGKELVINLPNGSKAIKQLEISFKSKENIASILRAVVLTGEFDNEQTLWVPVGDFFSNIGKQRPYQMWERSVSNDGTMVCRWVMPYKTKGTISLKNSGGLPADVHIKVTTDKWVWDNNSMHFHATWRMDEPYPTFPIFDWNFLEAEGKGVIVGDEMCVLNPGEGWWGEGDEKIYIDDDFEPNFPSHFGTGTEDYYGWAGGIIPTPKDEFSKPFIGNIIVGEPNSLGYNVCTRTRVLDAIPFQRKIKFDMEASCGTRSAWFLLQYSQTTFWYAIPGVKHNRKPLPNMASKPLPTLKSLQDKVEKGKNKQYVAAGAFEAEHYNLADKSDGVLENYEEIPVWGEISNNALKSIWFENKDDYAEIKITEQFRKVNIQMCSTVGPKCGVFDIFVNDILKATQDFYSEHAGMTTPLIQLGENDPVNNSFSIRFVYKGQSPKAKPGKNKYALGIDYFLIQN